MCSIKSFIQSMVERLFLIVSVSLRHEGPLHPLSREKCGAVRCGGWPRPRRPRPRIKAKGMPGAETKPKVGSERDDAAKLESLSSIHARDRGARLHCKGYIASAPPGGPPFLSTSNALDWIR